MFTFFKFKILPTLVVIVGVAVVVRTLNYEKGVN